RAIAYLAQRIEHVGGKFPGLFHNGTNGVLIDAAERTVREQAVEIGGRLQCLHDVVDWNLVGHRALGACRVSTLDVYVTLERPILRWKRLASASETENCHDQGLSSQILGAIRGLNEFDDASCRQRPASRPWRCFAGPGPSCRSCRAQPLR